MKDNALILDPCCGGRMFYFDKYTKKVLFGDLREESFDFFSSGKHRHINIRPDMKMDVNNLPFKNGSFKMVVFDPPHIDKLAKDSYMKKAYSTLPPNWHEFMRCAFFECWRILDPSFGVLIFKWSDCSVSISDFKDCFPDKPLFGTRLPKKEKTFWIVFVKGGDCGQHR